MFTLNDQGSAAATERRRHSPPASGRVPSHEAPHEASRFDSGTGQGTLFRMPQGEVLERPVLDGATEGAAAQRATENPFRGRRDPALGEWNYAHDQDHDHDVDYEPERREAREAEARKHLNDPETRHWYKYDPFREERNREKAERRRQEEGVSDAEE